MRIETGIFGGGHGTPGWTLDQQSNAPRIFDSHIRFKQSFNAIPEVIVALTTLDVDNRTNTLVQPQALDVGPEGFTARSETWSSTILHSVCGSWMAHGD